MVAKICLRVFMFNIRFRLIAMRYESFYPIFLGLNIYRQMSES